MHSTPALVAAAAARGLPRPLLWLALALYISFGYLAREPWRETELASMGLALELAQHGWQAFTPSWPLPKTELIFWLRPTLLGQLPDEHGPLLLQMGALLFKALPFIAPDLLWRLLGMGLLALCLACTWQAIYQLARHPMAQPLPFAIGGEATPLAYARALADTGLLAFIACFGLVQPVHETTPLLLQFTLWCVGFYGLALGHRHPRRALVALTLASFSQIFAGWPLLGLLLLAGGWGWSHISAGTPRLWRWRLLLLLLLWLVLYATLLSGWFGPRSQGLYSLALLQNFTFSHLLSFDLPGGIQTLAWFAWPLWPLAALALWRWRAMLWRSSHVTLPLCVVLAGLGVSLLFQGEGYDQLDGLLLTLPGLAALAAFAVPTLSRGAAAAIDWFALLLFTSMALVIWLFWSAMQWGWPAPLARNVAKLVPGFSAPWQPLALGIGLILTAAWAALVVWRSSRLRKPLWKTYALSAGGTVLVLGLLSSLFFPVLNYARSYQPWVAQLSPYLDAPTNTTPNTCVQVQGLTIAQMTALHHYRALPLERAHPSSTCPILLMPRTLALDLQNTLTHRLQGWQWRGYLRLATRRDKDNDDVWVYTR